MHQQPRPSASVIEIKMKTKWKVLSDILLTHHWVVPRQKREPEKPEHEKAGENQDAINEPFLCGKMHENQCNQADFESCDNNRDGDVQLSACLRRNMNMKQPGKEPTEVDIG